MFPPISAATPAQFGELLSLHELHLCLTATEPMDGQTPRELLDDIIADHKCQSIAKIWLQEL